ncbi:MAG TPA: CopD family protein [Candidatus Binatia bacterium]|nr:CopD family protein [Candidatus Binatia bacterium]
MITFSALLKFAHLAAAAFLVGSLAFHYFVAAPALRAAGAYGEPEFALFLARRRLALAKWTLVIVFLTGLLGLWLQVATVTGVSLVQALRPENVSGVLLGTRYGIVWLGRVGLMLLCAQTIFRAKDVPSNHLDTLTLVLAAALLTLLSLASHAAAGEGSWVIVQVAAYALHLLAAGVWLGGLPALTLFLRWLRRADRAWLPVALKETTRRFSLLGVTCVTALLITGLFNAWILIGGIPPLVGTLYGKLLLAKLAVLVPLFGIAAMNLLRLKPRILALGVQNSAASPKELLRKLTRRVQTEAFFGVCILLIVGFMSVTPPARHIQPEWPFAFRWNLNLLDSSSSKIHAQFTQAKWWGAAGLVGIFACLLLRRRYRYLVLGAGAACIGYGTWIAHSALSIDAYPATYLRPSVPYNAISVANGLRLYDETCAGCHGAGGYGDGINAEGLNPKAADLTGRHAADHTAGDLFWWLSHGMKVEGLPGPMPGFAASLEEEERWDLINFLRALSSAERARQMSAHVEPDPWLVAPDFVYRTSDQESGSLKDHRASEIVMVVLCSLPESRGRLAELNRASQELLRKKVKLLAIPREMDQVEILKTSFEAISLVADGGQEVFDAYALLRRSFSEQGSLPDPPVPAHMEFLIDRQGYVRARWIPRDGPGWDKMENLMREIDRLNQEKPSAPAPDDHVH